MPKPDLAYKFLGIFILAAIWQLLAAAVAKPILPTPGVVLLTFARIFPQLFKHAAASLTRVAFSMVLSILLAAPIGVLSGYFSIADKIISPIIYIAYPLPKISLLPIAMLFFGLGNASKICIMVFIIMFQLIVTIRDGVKKIPGEYFLPYLAAGCNFKDLAVKIIFPAALPQIFTGLRNSFAAALSVLFFSESYGTSLGLGYFVMDAWQRVSYKQMYAGILALGIMGMLIFLTLDFIQLKLCRG